MNGAGQAIIDSGLVVAHCVRNACLLELDALKPGNVHRHAEGHTLRVEQFAASANVIGPAMVSAAGVSAAGVGAAGVGAAGVGAAGVGAASVDPAMFDASCLDAAGGSSCAADWEAGPGARILAAIAATRRVVDTNTNLGIVLLCAPLVQSALQCLRHEAGPWPRRRFDAALLRTLRATHVLDAQLTYAAIRLAEPGGLGGSDRQDVRETPSVSLRAAMCLARERDRIAQAWCDGFTGIRGIGARAWRQLRGEPDAERTTWVYLNHLAAAADSLLLRRHGAEVARSVQARAAAFVDAVNSDARPGDSLRAQRRQLLQWDAELKRERWNPGTCADLTVATVLYESLVLSDVTRAAKDQICGSGQ